MAGLLDLAARFGAEERCIEHLAGLRWPGGFVCSGCSGRLAWRLKARPRVYESGTCHRQESVTAGTVFHRTRTDLMKWFLAAYLMGRDKRGVSAKFLQRELALAKHGRPEIFNTDQGSQFTGADFTGLLLANAIPINIDGQPSLRDHLLV